MIMSQVFEQVKQWLDAIYDDLEFAHLKDAPSQNPDNGNVKYAEQTRRTMRSLSASARRKAMKGVSDVLAKMSVVSFQAR